MNKRTMLAAINCGGIVVNIIVIDVSCGKSQATLIAENFEKVSFGFTHNRSGFKKLAVNLVKTILVIFETAGAYSAQLASYFRQFCELNPFEAKLRMAFLCYNKTEINCGLL